MGLPGRQIVTATVYPIAAPLPIILNEEHEETDAAWEGRAAFIWPLPVTRSSACPAFCFYSWVLVAGVTGAGFILAGSSLTLRTELIAMFQP